MAEGILKWLHGERIYVDSVGIRAGELNGFMVEVMMEVDINLSGHKPKTFRVRMTHLLIWLCRSPRPAFGCGTDPVDGL